MTIVGHLLSRVGEDLADRLHGPMIPRLLLQPVMAALLAIRSGLRDARDGNPPYFWALVSDPKHRRDMLRAGWKDIARVVLLGAVMDIVYQVIFLHWIYPGEALIVTTFLAFVPYLLLRGPVTRVARWMR